MGTRFPSGKRVPFLAGIRRNILREVNVTMTDGQVITVPYGTRVDYFIENSLIGENTPPVAGAFVNNEITSLSYKIMVNSTLKPIFLNTPEGIRLYRDSLTFLLTKAAKRLFPERRLVISNSLGNSYLFYFDNIMNVPPDEIRMLTEAMRSDIEQNLKISRKVISYQEAADLFREKKSKDTSLLLKYRNDSKIAIFECENYADLAHTPLVPETGMLKYFELMCYSNGFLLRFPGTENPETITPFADMPKLSAIYQEYKAWGKIQNFSSVGELNEHIADGRGQEIIRVAEALHNKKIGQIADEIAEKRGTVKVILIAGPSSSGKTTFAKKLSTQLKVVGFNPVAISLDDYYVPRELTPRDENGEYDFEIIDAIDIELLNKNLIALFAGEEVDIPVFDFKSGLRIYKNHKMQLNERSLIILEGIHGLNDRLTWKIDDRLKHRIYISALTQLNLDDHSRIPTTDNRLLRRMVRDFQYRNYSAVDTLSRWPSVRRGEDRNIFPFQGNADSVFNSALDYELSVLKTFAEPILKSVKPYDTLYSEAKRLQRFLSNFNNLPARYVPRTSILREFIGDSGFKY